MTEQEMEDATKDLSFDGSPDKILVSAEIILTKAIQKAIDGGWYSFADDAFGKITIDDILLRFNPHGQGLEWTVKGHESNWSLIEALIFSHDFAKALWGEEEWQYADDAEDIPDAKLTEGWQYHLQQMVIAEDPIAYLGEHLD